MRFETSPELRLFADSVRGAIGSWEPEREPVFGTWWDEHDEQLATRLAEVGWTELWADEELLGPAVAGGIELGRAVAPLSLVDRAALGAALAVGGRARHFELNQRVALVDRGALTSNEAEAGERVATLDGSGTVRVEPAHETASPLSDGDARLRAWGAATLGYLAGLASSSLDTTVAYVSSREQFGAPLSALPTMQARLADMALAVEGLELVAWEAEAPDDSGDALRRASLRWAAAAARDVTASAHQAHGGVGFALETGVHAPYRRAKSAQAWIAAVLEALRTR